MGDHARLAEVWPEVSRRLGAYLRRRGVSDADAQDIVQCVAERALKHDVPFGSTDELLFWGLTVAKHLDIDLRRAGQRRDCLDLAALDERASGHSLEDSVITRVRLGHTVDALLRMEGRDRALIMAGVTAQGVVSGAERVARHRARKRLLQIVGPAAVAFVAAGRRLFGPPSRSAVAPGLAAASLGMVVLVQLPSMGPSPAVDILPERVPSVAHVNGPPEAGPETAVRPESVEVQQARPVATPRAEAAEPAVILGEPTGTVRVIGHDRRDQDSGTVCVRDLPLVDGVCLGPTTRISADDVPTTLPGGDAAPSA